MLLLVKKQIGHLTLIFRINILATFKEATGYFEIAGAKR
jgi:hypothetical protein